MAAATTSDSTLEPLRRLLEEAHDGRIQVPEFQRGFTWADEWIKDLLASVSLSYPIGAVMPPDRKPGVAVQDPSHRRRSLVIDRNPSACYSMGSSA